MKTYDEIQDEFKKLNERAEEMIVGNLSLIERLVKNNLITKEADRQKVKDDFENIGRFLQEIRQDTKTKESEKAKQLRFARMNSEELMEEALKMNRKEK